MFSSPGLSYSEHADGSNNAPVLRAHDRLVRADREVWLRGAELATVNGFGGHGGGFARVSGGGFGGVEAMTDVFVGVLVRFERVWWMGCE
jgi:hypothetical protein